MRVMWKSLRCAVRGVSERCARCGGARACARSWNLCVLCGEEVTLVMELSGAREVFDDTPEWDRETERMVHD